MSCILCNFNIRKDKQFIFCFKCGMCFCKNCHGKILKKCGFCGRTEKLILSENQQFTRMLKFFNSKPSHPNIGIIANSLTSSYVKKKDYEKALIYAGVGAHEGIPFSRYFIGWSYLQGRSGLEKNYKLALHWITIAAEDEFPEAFYYLGMIYKKGLGVPKDPCRSTTCYLLGAMKGDRNCKEKLKK